MENIYIPYYNIDEFACYSVLDKDTIRAYIETPRANSSSNYIDFYINSHYLEKQGAQQFTQYSVLPTCLDKKTITNEVYYRNDFADILIILSVMLFFIIFLPYKVVRLVFGRWLKV